MKFLRSLQNKVLQFEQKEFYRNSGIFLGVICFLIFGIFYYYYSTIFSIKRDLKKINSRREEAQLILKKLQTVTKQKDEVDTLLDKEKNFKIQSYFDDTVKQLGLTSNQKRDADVSEEALQKGYSEIKLVAQFKSITMEQLCKLLEALEQKPRIYVKELVITKARGASLDITLTIATLKSQTASESKG